MALLDHIDLERGLAVARWDVSHRNFLKFRVEPRLVDADPAAWVEKLSQKIAESSNFPSAPTIVESPKPGGLVRPGSHLEFEDQVIYCACVCAAMPHIAEAVQGVSDIDYSFVLTEENNRLFRPAPTSHALFSKAAEEMLAEDSEFPYCVTSDITACYENVDIGLLVSDLRTCGVPKEVVDCLSQYLNHWNQTYPGLPQGQSPSDALAKLYLSRVDLQLRSIGFTHIRYVDDVKIFCRSEQEARRALVELCGVFRQRGMCLQSAKSKIQHRNEALGELDVVLPMIDRVKADLVEQLKDDAMLGEYVDMSEVDDLIAMKADDAMEILTPTFHEHVVTVPQWDKRMFRFLLKRFVANGSDLAADICVQALYDRPEETQMAVWYLARTGGLETRSEQIGEFIANGGDYVYPLQAYEVIGSYLDAEVRPPGQVLDVCRRWAFNGDQRYSYLRCISRLALGAFGDHADLERLLNEYDRAEGEMQKVEILLSVSRLERGRRNAFLSRVVGHSEWNRLGGSVVRAG